MEGRAVGIAIATVFPAASSPPNLFCSRPTRPADADEPQEARSDTFEEPIYVQDDNTDPSNSDSHGLTTCLPSCPCRIWDVILPNDARSCWMRL
uniref:Uncharacterized protein n=1 Tax=Oryza nivara TaxID=4536 RepID=A0A0E0HID7_ORYNI